MISYDTSKGFLLKIVKLSARCIKNLEKLRHKTVSISSACLILILTRNELIDGSIKHFSRSVLQIRIGFIVDIFDELKMTTTSLSYGYSTSGLLCLSTDSDGKF